MTDVQSSGPQSVDNGNPDCNDFTQTWNANYTDACTNDAVQVSVTYTWREDSQLPVISLATGDPDGTDLGCNPTVVPPTFTVSGQL